MELNDILKYLDEVLKQPVMDLELFSRKQQVLNNCLYLAPPLQLAALSNYLRPAVLSGEIDRFDGEAYLQFIEALARGEEPELPELSNYHLRYSPFVLDTLESSLSHNSSLELSPVLAPSEQPSEIIPTGTNLWALYLNKQLKNAPQLNSMMISDIEPTVASERISQIRRKQISQALFKLRKATRRLFLLSGFKKWLAIRRPQLPTPRSTRSISAVWNQYKSRQYRLRIGERLIENASCSIEQIVLWKWRLAAKKSKLVDQKKALISLKKLVLGLRLKTILMQWQEACRHVPFRLRRVLEKANIRWFFSRKVCWAKVSFMSKVS